MSIFAIRCTLLLSIFCVAVTVGQSDDNRKKKKKKHTTQTDSHAGHDHSKGGHGHSHDGGHGHSHDGAGHDGHTEQKVCPVMGMEINKDSKMYIDYNGHRIYACSEACRNEIESNFDTYMQKLEDLGQHPEEVN